MQPNAHQNPYNNNSNNNNNNNNNNGGYGYPQAQPPAHQNANANANPYPYPGQGGAPPPGGQPPAPHPHSQQPGQGQGPPPQQGQGQGLPPAFASIPEEQRAMILRVVSMTPEQIAGLPPGERAGVVQLVRPSLCPPLCLSPFSFGEGWCSRLFLMSSRGAADDAGHPQLIGGGPRLVGWVVGCGWR